MRPTVMGYGAVFLFFASAAQGQQQDSCAARLTENSPVREVISCIKQQQEQISDLRTAKSNDSSVLPSGTVTAFALENGCPFGWTTYDRAIGRTIVGVGQGDSLTRRLFLSQGGSEEHKLTVAQLPPHRFSTSGRGAIPSNVDMYNAGGKNYYVITAGPQIETETIGSGAPISIMSPYLALHICKKN